jgi:general secretion pathway protein D
VLRLKNGETSVLAGLISDEERKTTNHIPGLGEVPGIGRLFGTQKDTTVKTEIILLITPRVLRNIHRPDFGQPALPSGTEMAVGAAPLSVKTPGPKSLGMASKGGTSPAAGGAVTAQEAPAAEEPAPDPAPVVPGPATPPTVVPPVLVSPPDAVPAAQ